MMTKHLVCLVTLWLLWFEGIAASEQQRPNIVIIVADDLGWNDVSFHGSNQIPTPNIDALAYDGIILNRHYVPPLCTPTRASLMTGRHPMNIGMQDHVIISDEPWGLGLDQKLMPEYFREAGYRTHLVGKWHLGFFQRAYTPTYRGFESHYGYLGPFIDYWDHSLQLTQSSSRGLDMRRNTDVDYGVNGTYATDLFNAEAVRIIETHNTTQPLFLVVTHLAPHTGNEDDPLQAPVDEIAKFTHIQDPKRRILAAMISRIDTGVEQIYHSLEARGMLENSIILFLADNGAPTVGVHANSGSNHPLRGQKESPWEGGVRGAALLWSPLLLQKGIVSNDWFHVSDWLPTLGYAASISIPSTTSAIDGQNQWDTLQSAACCGRTVIMNNAHDMFDYSSYMKHGWKYVNGTEFEEYDGWLGELLDDDRESDDEYYDRLTGPTTIGNSLQLDRNRVEALRASSIVQCSNQIGTVCEPLKKPCLFDIVADPCERNNLAEQYPDVLSELESDVNDYRTHSVVSRRKPSDVRADPGFHNYTWTWWQDDWNSQYTTSTLKRIFSVLEKMKYSPWEGAVRGAALIWSPLLARKGVVSEQWLHVSDWLPTLGFVAGIKNLPAGSAIDGQNQWNTLQSASENGRSIVMNNADEMFFYSSYTKHGWKYVNGSCFSGAYDGWLGQLNKDDHVSEEDYYSRLTAAGSIGSAAQLHKSQVQQLRSAASIKCPESINEIPCEPLKQPCLFNILDDPCERRNLAHEHPEILNDLQSDVLLYKSQSARPRNQPADARSDPALYNFTWTWWQDEIDAQFSSHYLLFIVAAVEILVIMCIVCWSQKNFFNYQK